MQVSFRTQAADVGGVRNVAGPRRCFDLDPVLATVSMEEKNGSRNMLFGRSSDGPLTACDGSGRVFS